MDAQSRVPRSQVERTFQRTCPRRILNIAIATDAWRSEFENFFVQLTLEECRGLEGRAPTSSDRQEASEPQRGAAKFRWEK